jgi:hypothetical protein
MSRDGWVLVGADMEGLELRGLAHYLHPLDKGRYADLVLAGDPHWANAQAMGLVTGGRDKHNALHTIMREQGSKRFVYAFVYGCGNEKAGTIVLEACLQAQRQGMPEVLSHQFPQGTSAEHIEAVGKKIRNAFLRRTTGLQALKDKLELQVDRKQYLPGLDGRRVPVRSKHSALNFIIQSAGAILCKRWICDARDELGRHFRHGWDGDFASVLWVHDELQVACRAAVAAQVGEIVVQCARAAGLPYGFRVPLDSKYKVGHNWADTH